MRNVVAEQQKEAVRARARELGFAACGFTSADPLDCGPLLAGWLARGRHGLMGYLERGTERRVDPRAVLPAAASVVVAAWPYAPPPAPASDWRRRLTGRIAAYALGADYHDVLGERLAALAAYVGEECGGIAHKHVDAAPLVEKDLARRAGLGWFGRNTNVLTRELGSYFVLGCLLTEARFAPDPPFSADHCGTCRACVPACPTGALDDGPTIDATKCISYLTIELGGPIPIELRPRLGNWVFGCDVCQEVCPWNAPVRHADSVLEPSLPDLLTLDERQFRERYAATAVVRAKRRGLARNAAVALGNTQNPDAVAPLSAAVAGHDEPLVRAHAAWALGRLGTAAARTALAFADGRERIPPVRDEIQAALCAARESPARLLPER